MLTPSHLEWQKERAGNWTANTVSQLFEWKEQRCLNVSLFCLTRGAGGPQTLGTCLYTCNTATILEDHLLFLHYLMWIDKIKKKGGQPKVLHCRQLGFCRKVLLKHWFESRPWWETPPSLALRPNQISSPDCSDPRCTQTTAPLRSQHLGDGIAVPPGLISPSHSSSACVSCSYVCVCVRVLYSHASICAPVTVHLGPHLSCPLVAGLLYLGDEKDRPWHCSLHMVILPF